MYTPPTQESHIKLFRIREAELLCQRCRFFIPLACLSISATEIAPFFSPDFPRAPFLSAGMMAVLLVLYWIAGRNPSRSLVGGALTIVFIVLSAYVATVCAETGRFASNHILAMAVLLGFLPAMVALTTVESIVISIACLMIWYLGTRYFFSFDNTSNAGLTVALTYLSFFAILCTTTAHVTRRARLKAFKARKIIEWQKNELKRTVEELNLAQEKMAHQGRMAALGNIVSGFAHELGNPLNRSLDGGASLGEALERMENQLSELADEEDPLLGFSKLKTELSMAIALSRIVNRANGNLFELIERLRGFSEQGAKEVQSVMVHHELEKTLQFFDGMITTTQACIEIAVPQELEVECNRIELGQLLMTLIENACQAIETGGKIKIWADKEDDTVQIRISDNGPGIPEEHRQSIFDPFFTTKEAKGLGLAISHSVVQRHGGEMILEESELGGAGFLITLPSKYQGELVEIN